MIYTRSLSFEPSPITFAIPFYKGIPYLARALQSILAQEDQNWRAYVCDDGPEPGVEELVTSLGRGRIRYYKNPTNIGMAGNFNRCLDLAETDLVTVLHNDDELMPSYCGTFREASKRYPDAAALFCRVKVVDENSEPVFSVPDWVKDNLINPSTKHEIVLRGEPGIRALLKGNFINAPTLCFRKSVLGDRRFAELKFVLDLEMTTKLLLDDEILVGLPQRCYWYRRHDEAATSQYTRNQLRFREESEFYDRMAEECSARHWDRCVRLATGKRIVKLNVAYRALKSAALGDIDNALRGFALLGRLATGRAPRNGSPTSEQ